MGEANKDRFKQELLNQELDGLFAQYRDACPGITPSASFLPGMWERIERRRQSRFQLMHLSRMFLSGAAAIWLLLAGFLFLPPSNRNSFHHQGYIDALVASHDSDTLSFAELMHQELGEPDSR